MRNRHLKPSDEARQRPGLLLSWAGWIKLLMAAMLIAAGVAPGVSR